MSCWHEGAIGGDEEVASGEIGKSEEEAVSGKAGGRERRVQP
jgi:hypothetical protein